MVKYSIQKTIHLYKIMIFAGFKNSSLFDHHQTIFSDDADLLRKRKKDEREFPLCIIRDGNTFSWE